MDRSSAAILSCLCWVVGGCSVEYDPDDPQLAYAEAIPGFGGFFFDEAGAPTVYLTDPGQRRVAQEVLAPTIRSYGGDPARLRSLEGRYEFVELQRWFDLLSAELLSLPGLVFVDVDEGRNRLHLGVEGRAEMEAVARAVGRLGIPDEAVIAELAEPIVGLETLSGTVRPVLGGLQLSPEGKGPCTIGFNVAVTRKGNTTDHRRSFVTNSHCTRNPGATEGTVFTQGSSVIGIEIDDPPAFFCVGEPSAACRWSDAARVLYRGPPGSPVASALAGIARPTGPTVAARGISIQNSTLGTFRIGAELPKKPTQGSRLNKVGHATGWTVGPVTKTCASVRSTGTNRVFLCQARVRASASGGDSGSPVFERRGSPGRDVTLSGILWGGPEAVIAAEFWFSPMFLVERELGSLTTFTDSPVPTQQTPDLVPERRPGAAGPAGFCRLNGVGDALIVRVRNQGNVAVLSQTRTGIVFSPGGARFRTTPPIAAGASADLSFVIPDSCSGTDCNFTIGVDADLEVVESGGSEVDGRETNNIELGVCVG